MIKRRALATLALSMTLICGRANATTHKPDTSSTITTQEQASAAARVMAEKAFERMHADDADQNRFTRLQLEVNTITKGNGKVISHTTKLFEDIWINDLPYEHLLKLNGKPLAGQALVDETTRYNAAIANHSALDMTERARLTGGKVFGLSLDDSIARNPLYSVVDLGREPCGSGFCRHLHIAPEAGDDRRIKGQLRLVDLWVEEGTDAVARLQFVLIRNEGELGKGSSALIEWREVDG